MKEQLAVPLISQTECSVAAVALRLQMRRRRECHDGSSLAWALSYLMAAEPERFAKILEALKKVVPIMLRIRSRPENQANPVSPSANNHRQ